MILASEKISRRKALKTLAAAASGLGAAAFLPAKWMKPVIQSGVAPAHALTSGVKRTLEADNGAIFGDSDAHVLTIPNILAWVNLGTTDTSLDAPIVGYAHGRASNCKITLSYTKTGTDDVDSVDHSLPWFLYTGSHGEPADFGDEVFHCSGNDIWVTLHFSWNGQVIDYGPYTISK